jgi:hypothetical protein
LIAVVTTRSHHRDGVVGAGSAEVHKATVAAENWKKYLSRAH